MFIRCDVMGVILNATSCLLGVLIVLMALWHHEIPPKSLVQNVRFTSQIEIEK